jgi:large subunit ribosomal protein L10
MQKADKERVVAELTERLSAAETIIVADYRGLTVTQIGDLRGKLLEHGARFSVVKNTLTKRAAESAGVKPLLTMLEGPTAIAFLESGGDPVAVAKALEDAVKANVLTLKGGLLEGSEVSADEVRQLAKLPPTEMLRALVVGAVAGPVTMIVGLFTAPMRDLVGVLEARIAQLEERGEATADEAAPGDVEAPATEADAEAAQEAPAEEPAAEAEPEAAPEEAPAEEPAAEAEPEAAPEEAPAEEPAAKAEPEAAPEKAPAQEPAAEAEPEAAPEEAPAEEPAAEAEPETAPEEASAEEPVAEAEPEGAPEEPATQSEESQEGEEQ